MQNSCIFRFFIASLILLQTGCGNSEFSSAPKTSLNFKYETVDFNGPRSPWGKSAGDVNGDGLVDLLVGGHQARKLTIVERIKKKLGLFDWDYSGSDLVWYQNPSWQRHLVSEDLAIRTDLEVADINSDGHNDIVVLADSGLYWLQSPSWEKHLISETRFHDIELDDLDGDRDIDIIVRNQSLFGWNNGNQVSIFRNDTKDVWTHLRMPVPHGEGLQLADMDGDSTKDIIVNQQWMRNPGYLESNPKWQTYNYAVNWVWQDVFIDTGDFNLDGRRDIVLTPAEEAGEYYQIAWFEAPKSNGGPWVKHVIDPKVEAVHHFVAARDVDRDGDLDIFTAEMNQGQDPDEVKVYLNNGGDIWGKHVLGTSASHSMRAIDIDNDFDIDLFGADWQKADYEGTYPIELWRNTASDGAPWVRHLIDANRPGQATFVFAEDIDNDGLSDVITGGYWYRQPLSLNDQWQRFEIGEMANNATLLADFDGDDDIDVLASGWRGYLRVAPTLIDRILNRLQIKKFEYDPPGYRFVWGQNDGKGKFTIRDNIEFASGDYLQGVAKLGNPKKEKFRVLLSWHRAGEGLQTLDIPDDPENQPWIWSRLDSVSQDEQLSVGDIDNDGDSDILLGTMWLRRDGADKWKLKIISNNSGNPDRNHLVDLNKDGLLDVLVGYQAVSKMGKLAWYQQPMDGKELWTEHIIDEVIGPMSLGVNDIDGDGDMDIVVGEHNLVSPEQSRLMWFENLNGKAENWKGHLIYQGDEHHNGALLVDIDKDGDFDVVSIGWGHGKVIVYENRL